MPVPATAAVGAGGVSVATQWLAAGEVRPVPTGALYSVLLVLHVAAAVVGYGALLVTGVQAARARRGPAQPDAEGVRRYFRPGINWAGRSLYAVPVLGFVLVADSRSAFSSGDAFVVVGLVLLAISVVVAEAVVWPAERRIQEIVTERWGEERFRATLERDCTMVATASAVLTVLFVVAVVVMVGKP